MEYNATVQQAMSKQQSLTVQKNQGISDVQKKQQEGEVKALQDQADKFLKRKRGNPSWRSVPVLLTTALSISSNEWATSLGARCCFRKPIDPELLVGEVRALLGSEGGAYVG